MNQKRIFFEKTISVFAWLSFVLAMFITALTLVASFSGSDDGKEIFGHKLLIVNTDSMSKSPLEDNEKIFFNAGDLIVIKTSVDTTLFQAGDIITFISNSQESFGKTLTHKIREVKISNGQVVGYITYGINTDSNDSAMVPIDSVIGVYSFKIENLGKIFSFLKTSQGYYTSILIPILLLIVFFSLRVGKSLGEKSAHTQYGDEIVQLNGIVNRLEELCKKLSLQNTDILVTEDNTDKPNDAIQNCLQNSDNGLTENIKNDVNQKLSIPNANKKSFLEKLSSLDNNIKDYFNDVHNQLVLYKKINYRLSFKCISYRCGRKLLAKMTVRGKTLKLHLALNVNDFNQNVFFQKDLSSIKAYKEVPFTVKVKSKRGYINALKLIDETIKPLGLVKKSNYIDIDAFTMLNKLEKAYKQNEINENLGKLALIIPKAKKVSFLQKILNLQNNVQEYFDIVHNELISYKKIHERFSLKCVSYRLGRKLLAKMTVRGKTLKLHLALNFNDFNQNVFFQKDLSNMKAYNEVPFTVKVKSQRGMNNAIKLINSLMENNSIKKDEKFTKIDTIKWIKTNNIYKF